MPHLNASYSIFRKHEWWLPALHSHSQNGFGILGWAIVWLAHKSVSELSYIILSSAEDGGHWFVSCVKAAEQLSFGCHCWTKCGINWANIETNLHHCQEHLKSRNLARIRINFGKNVPLNLNYDCAETEGLFTSLFPESSVALKQL